MLDQLAALYPALFGETLLPLKRGIFQDLLAAQPEALDKDGLKAALALHTRSSRYLTAVASGQDRHDLTGQPVEPLAPEHVHHALIEVFRRRGARSREDLRPKMRQRIAVAFEASGLSRDAYLELVSGKDEEVNQITRDGVEAAATRLAKDEALLRTFEASGKSLNEFARVHARAQLSRSARIWVMSDGFDTDEPGHLATALAALRAHGARITWFHPTREIPAAAALRGARAHIDRFIPLASVADLVAARQILH